MLTTIFILLTIFIAFAIGSFRFSLMSSPLKLITIQLGISLVVQTIGLYLMQNGMLNEWLFNVYIPIEIWFLGGAALIYLNNNAQKSVLSALLIFATIVWLFQIYNNGIEQFAVWTLLTQSLILVLAYTTILFQLLRTQDKDSFIIKKSTFWIAISIIIYYGCNIPFFSFLQHLIEVDKNSAKLLFQINSVLCLIRYPLTGYALYLAKTEKNKYG